MRYFSGRVSNLTHIHSYITSLYAANSISYNFYRYSRQKRKLKRLSEIYLKINICLFYGSDNIVLYTYSALTVCIKQLSNRGGKFLPTRRFYQPATYIQICFNNQ